MDVTALHLPAGGSGFRSRIRASLPHLSASMTKIAQLLLDDPALPLELSSTELARRAGTSAATVTRFCRLIGYEGYVPLRVGAAADVARSSTHEAAEPDVRRALDPADSPADVIRTLLGAHVAALQSTADLVDTALVERVAAAVAASDQLDIYGIGGSATMARELQLRLYGIGVNAHAWGEVHLGLTSAALLRGSTVAIGISHSGRTKETIDMLSLAKSSGALAAAVTSDPHSPLAAVADVHITGYAPGEYLQPDDLSARYARLFVLDLLYLMVARQDFRRTTTMLAASTAAIASHRRAPRTTSRRPDPSPSKGTTTG
ncbi:MurR/RpiR family transcriptional regulator [Isoptericola sp. NPDC057653]|uniref:MurR/RpiR family transcriptional regulator n=1 Tax=Isoptericola sp. NPDC057653 TaxID=3346195 RepID=UPI00367FB474